MGIAFDTLAYSKRLESKGFTNQQAEALAEEQAALISERLATKQGLKELELALKRDIKELETTLKLDIEEVRRDVKELETSLRHDMKELELRFKHDMAALKHDLTLRMGGMLTVAVGVLAVLMRIL